MASVIAVHLRNGGKITYYDPGDAELKIHDHVIVETGHGVEYGTVMTLPKEVDDDRFKRPPRRILRAATEKDQEQDKKNHEMEDEAYRICKKEIRDHNLEMKLVEAEYTFDRNKLIFYFTADGRVDFRGLVKDLAGIFHTRIELRQIGVRDETRLLGGIGICGRELCCRSYLREFAPVSIKMAKEQNLSLNPSKISGVCGRLMCCLKNEEGAYEYLNKKLPRKGDEVSTKDGRTGEVQNVNVLRQRVRVFFEEDDKREAEEFDVADLVFEPGVHKKAKHNKKPQNGTQGANARGNVRGGRSGQGDRPNTEKTDRNDRGAEKDRGDRSRKKDGADRKKGGNSRQGNEQRQERNRNPEKGKRPENRKNQRRRGGQREESGGNRPEEKGSNQ